MDCPILHHEYFYHELLVNPVWLGDPTIDVTGLATHVYIEGGVTYMCGRGGTMAPYTELVWGS